MNTNFAWFLVVALGVSALMWQLSAVDSAIAGSGPADDLQSGDELEAKAPDNPRINGSASTSNGESDIVGLVISGAQGVVAFVGMLVLLPLELQRLGFPQWFAYPVGLAVQIIGSIGIIQFASNRELR